MAFKTTQDIQLDRLRRELAIIKQQAVKAATGDPDEIQYLILAALTGRQSQLAPDEIGYAIAELVADELEQQQ